MNNNWFSVFKEGGPWIQATTNVILAALFGIGFAALLIRFVLSAIKAKTLDEAEARAKIRQQNVKNVFALALLGGAAIITFTTINLIPRPSGISDQNFFEVFGSAASEAQLYFNLAITVLISVAILVYVIMFAVRMASYIASDDEARRTAIRKAMISATGWIVAVVLVLFIGNVILNVVPSPTAI